MARSNNARTFTGPDGTVWHVLVRNPGSSNAMVVFRHPSGESSRLDRYNWYITRGPEARSVTSRLNAATVLKALDDGEVARLFQRSMPVSTARDGSQRNLALGGMG
ncbi:MAG TPA: hypothetical protein VFZ11_10190 [Gemmatimonadaceae bacterium]